jgi:hypothetical protein
MKIIKYKDEETKEQDIKQALSLAQSPINSKQILHIMQKTPKDHVYSRPAKGGGNWDYVTGVYVKKVLNYAFGWQWDFEVKDHGREGSLVWVLGRLTCRLSGDQHIIKEQFGRADIKTKRGSSELLDFGNDLKAATTDALKKCASELGIASDIYGKEEFNEIKLQKLDLPEPKTKKIDMEEIKKQSEKIKEKIKNEKV